MSVADDASASPGSTGLEEFELRTLGAVLDCLHPADELGPGAVELGALDYVSRTVAAGADRFLGVYRRLLAELDAAARAAGASSYDALDQPRRVELLETLTQDGADTAVAIGVAVAIEHTYQGLFGDPAYGANRGGEGWRLVGYPGPRTEVRAEHQRLDVRLPTRATSIYTNPIFTLEGAADG